MYLTTLQHPKSSKLLLWLLRHGGLSVLSSCFLCPAGFFPVTPFRWVFMSSHSPCSPKVTSPTSLILTISISLSATHILCWTPTLHPVALWRSIHPNVPKGTSVYLQHGPYCLPPQPTCSVTRVRDHHMFTPLNPKLWYYLHVLLFAGPGGQ